MESRVVDCSDKEQESQPVIFSSSGTLAQDQQGQQSGTAILPLQSPIRLQESETTYANGMQTRQGVFSPLNHALQLSPHIEDSNDWKQSSHSPRTSVSSSSTYPSPPPSAVEDTGEPSDAGAHCGKGKNEHRGSFGRSTTASPRKPSNSLYYSATGTGTGGFEAELGPVEVVPCWPQPGTDTTSANATPSSSVAHITAAINVSQYADIRQIRTIS